MTTKLFAYITTVSILATFFAQPVLAKQYSFGPENSGITWQQLWDSSWQKAIPQTATATFVAGVQSIIIDRQTFLVAKGVAAVERKAIASSLETGLRNAAGEQLAKTVSKDIAKATAKKIAVQAAVSTVLKGLTVVGAVETVFEVFWPSDINWKARGTPLICVNSTTDKFPKCFAYFISKSSSAGIYWEALDPTRTTFSGDVTKYFFDVDISITPLLDLAFGRPEPKCSMAEVKDPGSSDYRPIATAGSKTYTNLQPGEHRLTVSCFTAGESSLAKKTIQTVLNIGTGVVNVVVESVTGGVQSLWDLITGQDVIAQAPDNYPTLSGLMNGTYTPPWPIPKDITHQASVAIAVNSPVAPEPIAPTLVFSADPYTVTPTRSSILSWTSDNADTCDASGGWNGPKNLSGKEAVTPLVDTTYALTCKGKGGSVEKSVMVTILNQRPIGNHEGVDNNSCRTWGWAYDPDASSQSIEVHIYRDGPAGGGGIILNKFMANISRQDVNTTKGISGNHGFDVNLSSYISDGKSHKLYVYPIDTKTNLGDPSNPLNLTPLTIKCVPSSLDIKAR